MEILRNFFTNIEVDEMNNEILKLNEEKDRQDYIRKYYEKDKLTINRIEYFVKHSELLRELAYKIEGMFENYTFFKDKINFKYPNSQMFNPHQDIAAGWGKYGEKHKTVAIFMDDTDINNGCIEFVTDESFNNMLTSTEFQDLDYSIVSEDRYKPIATKKGDIIIFDSMTPHQSGINKSNKPRICLFFSYVLNGSVDVYEKYHLDKFEACPPDIYKKDGMEYRNGNTNETFIFKK